MLEHVAKDLEAAISWWTKGLGPGFCVNASKIDKNLNWYFSLLHLEEMDLLINIS